ncbi:hypothetical protein QGN32_08810 [Mycolicibacterium sp. ND9-15]|nr:hypothetical protein [Mycolicibacterium sp. ND9-15]WSE57927.1 hypothetical protein QGN32_08810 [Mycolicibacterium sp. ND9-15]
MNNHFRGRACVVSRLLSTSIMGEIPDTKPPEDAIAADDAAPPDPQ